MWRAPSTFRRSSAASTTAIPSFLIDAVTEHEPGNRLVAVKNVTVSEEFFQGHFPGSPLMPAVLMIEALTQVAAVLLLERATAPPTARVSLRGVDNAKFRRRSSPAIGSASRCTLGRARTRLAKAQAAAYVGRPAGGRSRAAARHRARRGATSIRPRTCIPRRRSARAPTIGPHCDRSARTSRIGKRLPDRRIGRHRRLDRDRRRDADLPDGVDRPGAAGPQVSRRDDRG